MRRPLLALLSLALAACDTVGDDAAIVRYTGPEITEADALVEEFPGHFARWTAGVFQTRSRTTVAVSQVVLCGDECSRTTDLVFAGDGALPASVAGTVVQQEYLPERFEETPLAIHRVEIQDWGPAVYSGIVYPVSPPDAFVPPIVFWTDDLVFAAE